jgi:hypothetical protein
MCATNGVSTTELDAGGSVTDAPPCDANPERRLPFAYDRQIGLNLRFEDGTPEPGVGLPP